ncbi:MAG: hypothetical protein CMF62_11550 [Magnetococcales bacterium]|nr:hypothetical protein [Magnetococcales bacterium]|tara:strand:+ start:305038 stop:306042 length:1005 start_codon:yes stop_codon:yes gene_type:complete
MADATWYYEKDGEAIGPFQKRLIESFIRSKVITPETLVWEDGTEKQTARVALGLPEDAEPTQKPAEIKKPEAPTPTPEQQVPEKTTPELTTPVQPSPIADDATPYPQTGTDATSPERPPNTGFSLTKPLPHPLTDFQMTPPKPALRGFAKLVDFYIVIQAFSLGVVLIAPSLSPATNMRLMVWALEVKNNPMMWTFIIAAIIVVAVSAFITLVRSHFGATLGEWITGTRLTTHTFEKPQPLKIFFREAYVSTLGAGGYTIYLGWLLPVYWYFYIIRRGLTPWDNTFNTVVVHNNQPVKKTILKTLLIIAIVIGSMVFIGFVMGVLKAINRGIAS